MDKVMLDCSKPHDQQAARRALTTQEQAALDAVQQASALERAAEGNEQTADSTDRTDRQTLITQLQADRTALLDTGQSFTIAMLRPILARVITLQLVTLRMLARRGL